MRPKTLDYLALVLIYVIVISLPYFSSLPSTDKLTISVIFQTLFGMGVLSFYGPRFNRPIWRYSVLPLSLFAFLNIPVVCLQGIDIEANYGIFIQNCFLTLGTVFAEELLFRQLFSEYFLGNKRWVKLILSSSFFALPHALSILSSPSLGGAMNVGYTFALGLVLWIVFESGLGYIGSFLLHLLFNLLMGEVFSYLGGVNSGLPFYLINLLGGFLIVAYGLVVYFKPKKIRP